MPTLYPSFQYAIQDATQQMRNKSRLVSRGQWQGTDVSKRPEMVAHEISYFDMRVRMKSEDLDDYRRAIRPNLPWADDHFLERVSGEPMNPGVEWANWPWGKSADKFRDENGQFDHNYMERYWAKYAGNTVSGSPPHRGIRFYYGDLEDVIAELAADPTTRQAVLPIFFPEDTGLRPGRRKPCSLFYQFHLVPGPQHQQLDIVYYLRSCDLIRHFRDDIYLTVRLLLWVLAQLRNRGEFWRDVVPGDYVMLIANLHCFRNDFPML